MINSYVIPGWFVGFDIVMEILFAIVAFAVSVYARKVYKISKEKNINLFSLGFLSISISYLIWAAINLFLVKELLGSNRILEIEHLQMAGLIGVYLHMALFVIGIVTIFYANFRTNKQESYYLMIGLGLLSVFTYINDLAAFHLTSVFILLFINYHYFKEYINNKNHKTLLVFIAFILLFLSHLVFIFPYTYEEYVIAHFLELIAYAFILFSLMRTVKR